MQIQRLTNNMEQGGINVLTFILPWYWRSTHTPSRTHTHTHTNWHIAAENYQDQRRTHRAPSTTYAKVLQVSVTWKSWVRAISLQNRHHKWPARAHSSRAQTASLHQYLKQSQVFIGPDRLSVLSVFLEALYATALQRHDALQHCQQWRLSPHAAYFWAKVCPAWSKDHHTTLHARDVW